MDSIRDLVDAALEISVVGSFSRIGPAVRRSLDGWTAPSPTALEGQTVVVTGPTSGLGLAATQALAAIGARVVLVGRDDDRSQALSDRLTAEHGVARFPVVVGDLGSLASVRAAVERILATEARLDVIVDNAGAMFADRRSSPDGIEATFAVLVVGPFALVDGLLPLLRRTAGSRVVAVTSGGMYAQRLDLDDLESRAGTYSGARTYARAKRAQVALMREWSRRLFSHGIGFAAMHPGWADTPGLAGSLPGFYRVMRPVLRSPAEAVDTIVWLATQPDPRSITGRLFLDRRARPFDRVPGTSLTAAQRRRLWDLVAAMADRRDPEPDDPTQQMPA